MIENRVTPKIAMKVKNITPDNKFKSMPILITLINPIFVDKLPLRKAADAYKIVMELQIKPKPVELIPKSFENTVEPTARIAKKLPVVKP
jgi:hypothetical protein